MGTYTVWVVGSSPYSAVEEYDECNDIPGSFPGLTFDYIADVEEPGPAYYFLTLLNDTPPFAIVTADGQIVRTPHPGSEQDSSVSVGRANMRAYLENHPNEVITPMKWHC